MKPRVKQPTAGSDQVASGPQGEGRRQAEADPRGRIRPRPLSILAIDFDPPPTKKIFLD